jgi:hypothetical protein
MSQETIIEHRSGWYSWQDDRQVNRNDFDKDWSCI